MTPAETPTEVCVECQRLTVTGHGTFPYAGGHTLALHARIRELEGALTEYQNAHQSIVGDPAMYHERLGRAMTDARAALARSEAKP